MPAADVERICPAAGAIPLARQAAARQPFASTVHLDVRVSAVDVVKEGAKNLLVLEVDDQRDHRERDEDLKRVHHSRVPQVRAQRCEHRLPQQLQRARRQDVNRKLERQLEEGHEDEVAFGPRKRILVEPVSQSRRFVHGARASLRGFDGCCRIHNVQKIG